MKGKLIWSIFWAMVGVFVIVVSMIFIRPLNRSSVFAFVFLPCIAVFFLLGVTLIVLTVRAKVGRMLKGFLLLTGASVVGLPVFGILHNVVYGLFQIWFGADFWKRTGLGDEPVFFILAVIICPAAFLVGAVGSVVLAIKEFRGARQSPSI